MFCRLYHQVPGGDMKAICHFSDEELYVAYKRLLSDLKDSDGTNIYEPVAEGIRSEWRRRGLWKRKLIDVEKQFKRLKRTKTKNISAPNPCKRLHIRGQKINFNKN